MYLLLLIALSDALTQVNLSALYGIPILLTVVTRGRRTLWLTLALCEVLTFLVLPIKMRLGLIHSDVPIMMRVLNRGFVALALLSLGSLVAAARSQSTRRHGSAQDALDDAEFARLTQDGSRDEFEDLWESLLSLLAVAAAGAAIVAIAVTDMTTQANLNPAILYAVPLTILIWCRSKNLIWWAVAAMLVLSFAGGFIGPTPPTPVRPMQIVIQRLIVGSMLLITSVCITRVMSPATSRVAA